MISSRESRRPGSSHAADIGCGPGNSTEVLRERYPEARIVGLDSSPDMIEAARKRLPHIAFEVADIREWRSTEPLDVILANARRCNGFRTTRRCSRR